MIVVFSRLKLIIKAPFKLIQAASDPQLLLLKVSNTKMNIVVKRVFDVVVASISLLVFSPVLAVVAYKIRRELGSPVVFKQMRPGLHGKPFQLIKFRSMGEQPQGSNLSDQERLTPFGRKLRASSLDELPELINVLKGDMSFVGPRPLLMEYLPLYSVVQNRRHEVKPGITGWAQVKGRNAISWEEKFEHDVWYVDNHHFFLDVWVLLLTFVQVIRKDNISAEGHATMARFEGSKKVVRDKGLDLSKDEE